MCRSRGRGNGTDAIVGYPRAGARSHRAALRVSRVRPTRWFPRVAVAAGRVAPSCRARVGDRQRQRSLRLPVDVGRGHARAPRRRTSERSVRRPLREGLRRAARARPRRAADRRDVDRDLVRRFVHAAAARSTLAVPAARARRGAASRKTTRKNTNSPPVSAIHCTSRFVLSAPGGEAVQGREPEHREAQRGARGATAGAAGGASSTT